MVITHYGIEMFKLQSSDLNIVINPISKKAIKKSSRYSADIVLRSSNLDLFNDNNELNNKADNSFVIDGPGEYEIKGIFVKGTLSKCKLGGKEHLNTIYTIQMEGMNLVFLGPVFDTKLKMDFIEDIDTIDILFVPIGGGDVLSPQEAFKLAVSIEPKVVIPMHYKGLDSLPPSALDDFLKEAGQDDIDIKDKLNIKKKQLENKSLEIQVVQSK